jgi:hypothetical protein
MIYTTDDFVCVEGEAQRAGSVIHADDFPRGSNVKVLTVVRVGDNARRAGVELGDEIIMLDTTFERIAATLTEDDVEDGQRAICRPAAEIDNVVKNDYLLGERT